MQQKCDVKGGKTISSDERGKQLIRKLEDFKPKTYYDLDDKKKIGEKTICYGHTGKDVNEGQTATK